MRPVNLFLSESGVLKVGYYGLITQAECFSIKEEDCDGLRSFAPEVSSGVRKMKSDVWSLGITLIEMMGIMPYVKYPNGWLPTLYGEFELPCTRRAMKSTALVDFLDKCFRREVERWSMNELMNVSGM